MAASRIGTLTSSFYVLRGMNTRVVALAAGVLLLGATPSPTPTVPPALGTIVQNILQTVTGNAVAPYGVDPNHVRGTVMFFKRFDLQVRMPLPTPAMAGGRRRFGSSVWIVV